MTWSARLPDHCVHGVSDTTVFLLHGIYGSKDYWRFVTERLVASNYRVVAWDAPGYGFSPPAEGFTLMGAAKACARLIGKLGTSKNVVFGQSMGGQIAMRACRLVPGLIDGVIISSTIGYLGNKTPAEREQFVQSRRITVTDKEPVAAKNLRLVTAMMAAGAAGSEVDLVRAVCATTPAHAVQAAVNAIEAAPDAEAIGALKAIHVPALFVAGEVDTVGRPDGMKRIADMVPNSKFEIVPACGHYTWAENPQAFWSIASSFLSQFAK
jgi:pimeloyl-ACP methyl ester carboxylesterase